MARKAIYNINQVQHPFSLGTDIKEQKLKIKKKILFITQQPNRGVIEPLLEFTAIEINTK